MTTLSFFVFLKRRFFFCVLQPFLSGNRRKRFSLLFCFVLYLKRLFGEFAYT